MEINKEILKKINMVEGEKTTEYIDILYEFLLDQGYNWIRNDINYFYSSLDLVNYIKYIIGVEVSNLDLKYCMEFLGIKSNTLDITESEGVMYYPVKKQWIEKIKFWSAEFKDRLRNEEKYRKMRKAIIEGTSNYIVI